MTSILMYFVKHQPCIWS